MTLEEALRRLSEEEGLLRRLAELLEQASGERGERDTKIAQEMAGILGALRPDLKQALSQALEPGNEDLVEAEAIVAAALEGLSHLQREAQATERGEGGAWGFEEGREFLGEFWEPRGEILLDEELQAQMRKELEEAQEGLGLGAGWEEGEPVRPGIPEKREVEAEPVLAAVRPGEGPWRTGVALGLPGENPGEEEGFFQIPPQEVELFLRERPIPPGLRELVRRYFEILSGGE